MAQEQKKDQHTQLSGGFNQHTPPYWRLMMPALMARYIPRWVNSLRPPKPGANGNRNAIYDIAAGTWALGVTGYFALQTGRDIKNIFTEAVAYEVDKKPADVNASDLTRSDNLSLRKARKNFLFYNTLRAAVNSSFFVSFIPGGRWHAKDSVDLGVGLNGAYLVSEVVLRNTTFFEQLQAFVDRKINQGNALGEDITPIELTRLFERNALDNDIANAFKGNTDTAAWKKGQVIFERMAELMNFSYQPTEERAENFKLPKFLYLLGHNLIQPKKPEQTIAFIEVANRYGMSALKQVVKEVGEGVELSHVMQRYPVDFSFKKATQRPHTPANAVLTSDTTPSVPPVEPAAAPRSFAEKVEKQPALAAAAAPANYTDRVAQQDPATLGASLG